MGKDWLKKVNERLIEVDKQKRLEAERQRHREESEMRADLTRLRAELERFPDHCRACERRCKYAGASKVNGAMRCAECLRVEELEAQLAAAEAERDEARRERDEANALLERREVERDEAGEDWENANSLLSDLADLVCKDRDAHKARADAACELLRKIRAYEKVGNWNSCTDCDHTKRCSPEEGCYDVETNGLCKISQWIDAFLASPGASGGEQEAEQAREADETLPCGLCDERARRVTEAGKYRCPRGHWSDTNQTRWQHPDEAEQARGGESSPSEGATCEHDWGVLVNLTEKWADPIRCMKCGLEWSPKCSEREFFVQARKSSPSEGGAR